MNYYKQVIAVTLWEYRRFFKLKNELLAIVIMLLIFTLSYFGGKYAASLASAKVHLAVLEDSDSQLIDMLSKAFDVEVIAPEHKEKYLEQIIDSNNRLLLMQDGEGFKLYARKKSGKLDELQHVLDGYNRIKTMRKIELSAENLALVLKPAPLEEVYSYERGSRGRTILAYFFAGLMILAVILSFAYQFTAITGEKQLKITEQIVSAIKPQVWMDGKILGITITGLSSMFIYSFIGILAGLLYFQFSDRPITDVTQYLHLPSILLYIPFTLMGIMLWNALLAAIAAVITDPNNSGKSSLMLLPVLFVGASFLVLNDPDTGLSVFLSWFPLTSATAMPVRWLVTDVVWWNLIASFAVLAGTFYWLRKLAAKIFRVSVLISGKEPTWAEVIKLTREA